MKVLLINKFFFLKGGAETIFFNTANLLKNYGHEVAFFSMIHPNNIESPYSFYFVPEMDFENPGPFLQQIRASGRILYSFEACKKLDVLLKKEKPDIVHLHSIHHQISPSILHVLKHHSLPIVMTLHDYKLVCPSWYMKVGYTLCERCKGGKYYYSILMKCHKDSLLKSALVCLESYLHHRILGSYGHIHSFLCPSKFLMNKIEEAGLRGNFVYLPNFVMADQFKPLYEGNSNLIAYVGRLSREKGLTTLVRAVKGLQVMLQIIGDGPFHADLVNLAAQEGIGNVQFLGHLEGEPLRQAMCRSLCLVCPSEWHENNPLSILEAFALGKPVIGSRIGGIPELVKENETGLLFQPGDVNALREKIEYFMKSRKEIVRMGIRARRLVESEFSPEIHYKRLMEIYHQARESS